MGKRSAHLCPEPGLPEPMPLAVEARKLEVVVGGIWLHSQILGQAPDVVGVAVGKQCYRQHTHQQHSSKTSARFNQFATKAQTLVAHWQNLVTFTVPAKN